jgi:hypothetical protein
MNRLAAFSFAFLLGSLTSGAQAPALNPASGQPVQQGTPGLPAVYVFQAPADLDCPVPMRARHEGGGNMRYTQSGQKPAPPPAIAQRIRLILGSGKEPAAVLSARVTVRGTSAKWRTVPTSQLPNWSGPIGSDPDGSDLKRTLNITFHPDVTASVEANEGLSSEMVLSGFTSVQSITLDSLTYTDGSIWTPETGRGCRVTPDPLMLVSAGH